MKTPVPCDNSISYMKLHYQDLYSKLEVEHFNHATPNKWNKYLVHLAPKFPFSDIIVLHLG